MHRCNASKSLRGLIAVASSRSLSGVRQVVSGAQQPGSNKPLPL